MAKIPGSTEKLTELPPPEDFREPRRTVTPIHWMFMQLDLATLVGLLEKTHLRFSLTTSNRMRNLYHLVIWDSRGLEYQATGRGVKATLADCLAKYFRGEERDFHEAFQAGIAQSG